MFCNLLKKKLFGINFLQKAQSEITHYRTMAKFQLPERLQGTEKSIWVDYNALAAKYKPINLGQGFPDFLAPINVRRALKKVSEEEDPLVHQYTRGYGHLKLTKVLGKLYSKLIGRKLDADLEILVTSGAYEALYVAIHGHTNPGDEWIVIEPYFDCYVPMIKTAGGIPKYIALKPKGLTGTSADWILDPEELEGLFNDKTKGIILNTPNNPLGKVYTLSELALIANLATKWNCIVISDEVYEWIVYEPYKHIRIASFPGMFERTITIGSAGKTFSVTGWKVGWAYGPEQLLYNMKVVHQNCVYTCPTPLQEALAIAFEEEIARFGTPECYFMSLPTELMAKRDYMAKLLKQVGMTPIIPEGGYFMIANWDKYAHKIESDENDSHKCKDYKFTYLLATEAGVLGIPPTAFYSEDHKYIGESYVRYCFMKSHKVLENAENKLLKWKSSL